MPTITSISAIATRLYASYRGSLRERYPFSAHSASDVALADFREFFKARAWRTVFERYLKPFVSGSAGEYQIAPG